MGEAEARTRSGLWERAGEDSVPSLTVLSLLVKGLQAAHAPGC